MVLYEYLFDYTDVDGEKFQAYKFLGDYYFKVNGESVEMPKEIISKLIETLSDKSK